MLKIIKNIFLISLFFIVTNCDQATQSKNNSNSILVVKVFSSLTCPHCADFHGAIYKKLKNEYISIGKIKFEHHAFPLDLAALNAEKILQCSTDDQTNMTFLTEIYKKQNKWTMGSDIEVINESIKKIGKEFNLTESQMNKCLVDENLEEKILNERIKSQKNYKVKSTPTIYLNKKKYEGKRDYKSFKKAIDNILS
jgi:protein-disulfide isomerase